MTPDSPDRQSFSDYPQLVWQESRPSGNRQGFNPSLPSLIVQWRSSDLHIHTKRASPLRCRIRTPELRVRHPATNNGVSIREKAPVPTG